MMKLQNCIYSRCSTFCVKFVDHIMLYDLITLELIVRFLTTQVL
jgi:hypothetical protein